MVLRASASRCLRERRACGASVSLLQFKWKGERCFATEASASSSDELSAVVIGGGVLGSSIAYHLALAGQTDVVLLERRAIASGTTSHSCGLVSAGHPNVRYKPIFAYSVELYSKMAAESSEFVGFSQPGTLRVATTPQRMDEFRLYTARDWFTAKDVCRTRLLQPDQVAQLCPLLDMKQVLGALYTEADGYVSATGLTRAMSSAAQALGVNVLTNAPVSRIAQRSDGTWDVETSKGTLRCKHVVNAAGLGAREAGLHVGYDPPLVYVEHQYATIGPVSSNTPTADLPAVIDHDSGFYIRPSGDKYLFGAFDRASDVTVRRDWTVGVAPLDVAVEPAFDRVAHAYERACDLLPSLAGAAVQPAAGVCTMTPDAYPLLGPLVGLRTYWVAMGFFDGVATGGGAGKYLADWIVNGEPPFELFDADPNRYSAWADKDFCIAKAAESYTHIYNWATAFEDRPAGRPTQRVSGTYGALIRDGGKMHFRTGWEVPSWFAANEFESENDALLREYEAVTTRCGIIDMSFKGKIEIRGPDSDRFLNFVFSNQPPEFSHISQNLMLTSEGRVLSLLKTIHHDQFRSEYILLSDPEHEGRDLRWLRRKRLEHSFDVQIHPVSEFLAALAVLGPSSREVLSELTKTDLSDASFPHHTTKLLRLSGVPVIAARASATGELGWELFHNRAESLKLYEALMRVGRRCGMCNFGTQTLDTLRLEKGYKLWGKEITLDTDPIESGLDMFVDMAKNDFIGKRALTELRSRQSSRRLVLLRVDGDESLQPRGMECVRAAGSDDICGQVTSGCFSISLKRPLCFAWLATGVNSRVSIDLGQVYVDADILDSPPGVADYERSPIGDDSTAQLAV